MEKSPLKDLFKKEGPDSKIEAALFEKGEFELKHKAAFMSSDTKDINRDSGTVLAKADTIKIDLKKKVAKAAYLSSWKKEISQRKLRLKIHIIHSLLSEIVDQAFRQAPSVEKAAAASALEAVKFGSKILFDTDRTAVNIVLAFNKCPLHVYSPVFKYSLPNELNKDSKKMKSESCTSRNIIMKVVDPFRYKFYYFPYVKMMGDDDERESSAMNGGHVENINKAMKKFDDMYPKGGLKKDKVSKYKDYKDLCKVTYITDNPADQTNPFKYFRMRADQVFPPPKDRAHTPFDFVKVMEFFLFPTTFNGAITRFCLITGCEESTTLKWQLLEIFHLAEFYKYLYKFGRKYFRTQDVLRELLADDDEDVRWFLKKGFKLL